MNQNSKRRLQAIQARMAKQLLEECDALLIEIKASAQTHLTHDDALAFTHGHFTEGAAFGKLPIELQSRVASWSDRVLRALPEPGATTMIFRMSIEIATQLIGLLDYDEAQAFCDELERQIEIGRSASTVGGYWLHSSAHSAFDAARQ